MSALDISLNTSFIDLAMGHAAADRARPLNVAAARPGSLSERRPVSAIVQIEQAFFALLGGGFLVMATSFAMQILR